MTTPRRPQVPPPPPARVPAPARGGDARRAESATIEVSAVGFLDEEPTKPSNQTMATYSALLVAYDALSNEGRLDVVEIATLWPQLSRRTQRGLLDVARREAR